MSLVLILPIIVVALLSLIVLLGVVGGRWSDLHRLRIMWFCTVLSKSIVAFLLVVLLLTIIVVVVAASVVIRLPIVVLVLLLFILGTIVVVLLLISLVLVVLLLGLRVLCWVVSPIVARVVRVTSFHYFEK